MPTGADEASNSPRSQSQTQMSLEPMPSPVWPYTVADKLEAVGVTKIGQLQEQLREEGKHGATEIVAIESDLQAAA